MGVTRFCGTIAQPAGSIDQCKHLYLVLRCSVLDMTIRFSRSYQFQHPSSISTPHPVLCNPLTTITHTVPSASLSSYTSRPKHCYFSASIPEPPASPATTTAQSRTRSSRAPGTASGPTSRKSCSRAALASCCTVATRTSSPSYSASAPYSP